MAARRPAASSARSGDRLVGSFTIEEEIGKGSFATVYRGTQKVNLFQEFWADVLHMSFDFPSSMVVLYHSRSNIIYDSLPVLLWPSSPCNSRNSTRN